MSCRFIAAAAFMLATAAHAAAPQVHTQAPGWYRTMLGRFEITALSDGTHTFPLDTVMTGVTPAAVDAALANNDLHRPVQGSINAFLVNTGTQLVLIDAGAGALYGACCGKLLANLRAAGYRPEQVDVVLLTHLHKDHVGGVLADGKPAFPNAVVRAAGADADYWLSRDQRAAAPAFLASFFDSAAASLAPYTAAGRFQPFAPGAALVPGIRAVAEPGHTPGHSGYLVEDGGQALLVWGDVVHVAAVQLDQVQATVKYDSSAPDARATRAGLLERAAREHLLVGAAHVAFPGLGHVRREGAGFAWLPLNYEGDPADPH
ncbi:MBL fold metallo-hydrolase [Massilia sp. Root133]|uniref:MBL fold metallo-hydrolase n=1 Tax=Massilia cellulosiltytica TaxID=2683234 RepID=A0A7X3G4V1_9BURK|nr:MULTISPECIES: MBL fold metallo-hydrolase [Telluria group]KQY00937.1 MBL fold metallo-hydrolase [Massilia sp. Root133]KQZ53034.1 MBL fold metallo-hydrolase [Massilia sp. Root1485]MVW63705.1 MBL fold metallo-hydrolase [Telluria cellulosilytica]